VGIVADVRYRGWTSVWVDAYVPDRQWSFGRMDLMLRTTSTPSTVVPALRAAVYAGDPDLPIAGVTTMEQAVADAVAGPRLTATLLGLLAGAAALLAAVGIHGVMAASVARRTREIGVRMALGAARRTVLWLVMRDVATMAAFGIGIGLPSAWALSRLVESQLFGLSAADPATAATAIGILVGVTVAAGYIPARRATLVEPMTALRHE
jgi:ABC-type antimicrobial peptide transport system permease subunit